MAMTFVKNLYLGKRASDQASRIKWKLRHNAGMIGTYCVTFPLHGGELLEIYHSGVLMQPWLRRRNPCVVGLAEGYGEALSVVSRIVEDVYRETGEFDMRSFFVSHPEAGGIVE